MILHKVIKEIVRGNCLMNGFTPALLFFLSVCNLNGEIMPKKIEYKSEEQIGECFYIKDVETSNRNRTALFECKCGNKFITQIGNVKSGITKSCGCLDKKYVDGKANSRNHKHGLALHPIHSVWNSIKQRCYNDKNKAFCNYGGRGIGLYELWIGDFKAFYDYVVGLPQYGEDGMTLDRINNDGNYEPGNLRWTDRSEQCKNRRPFSNKTGETGLSIVKSGYRLKVRGQYLGVYKTISGGVSARDRYIAENNILINVI